MFSSINLDAFFLKIELSCGKVSELGRLSSHKVKDFSQLGAGRRVPANANMPFPYHMIQYNINIKF